MRAWGQEVYTYLRISKEGVVLQTHTRLGQRLRVCVRLGTNLV